MPFCSYSKDAAMFDVTPIENEFLLDFMPAAPENAVRVYLYVRMLCAHPEMGGGVAEVAQALRMEEDEVLDNLAYWEQMGLVEKLGDRPARFEVRSVRGAAERAPFELEADRYVAVNAALRALFGDEDKLQARHLRMAGDWMDMMGFSQEAAVQLVKYELRLPGGRKPDAVFKRADKRAIAWSEKGIRSLDEVKRAIAAEDRVRDLTAAVIERLGMGARQPSLDELESVRRWIEEWRLTEEDVLEACAQTTKARSPSIGYLDAILKGQVEAGAGVYFGAVKAVLRELGAMNAAPTPQQLEAYAGYLARGFAPETVRLAAAQCAGKNRNRFEDLQWMLDAWDGAGVHSRDEAEAYVRDMRRRSEELGELLKLAGLNKQPNMAELALYGSWPQRYAPEMIRCAAELARGKHEPVQYMDRMLKKWAEAGIITPEAARRARDAKPQGSAPERGDYLQHDYKESDFGKDFFYDLDGNGQPDGNGPKGGDDR